MFIKQQFNLIVIISQNDWPDFTQSIYWARPLERKFAIAALHGAYLKPQNLRDSVPLSSIDSIFSPVYIEASNLAFSI